MTNRMSEQTKTWIFNSFFDLLIKSSYKKITIKEISQHAQISRRTFYRIFNSKDNLLQSYFEELLNNYLKMLKKNTSQNFENFVKNFFDFWTNYTGRLKLLERENLLTIMLNEYNKKIPELYEAFPMMWHLKTSDNRETTVATWFVVGGLWNVFVGLLSEDDFYDNYDLSQVITETIFRMGNHR
ncbi:TetR/AcrR family transcriptional regulator [Fructilactobacillus fructivorans]|nr:TetR/AcrR family transcriptional regulator [Fructilactobacillus fructivorans]